MEESSWNGALVVDNGLCVVVEVVVEGSNVVVVTSSFKSMYQMPSW